MGWHALCSTPPIPVPDLWHCGAISTHDNQPDGRDPPSASAIQPEGELFVPGKGMQRIPTPRALTVEEIAEYVELYRQGSNNSRTDQYGGSIENRTKFPLEVTKAVLEEVGKDRVGIRLSPFGGSNGMRDDQPPTRCTST